MNSRERLLKAIRREATDRVPINTYELSPYNSRSFENAEPSYRELMRMIGANCDATTMWNPAGNGALALSAYDCNIERRDTRDAANGATNSAYSVVTPCGRTLTWQDKVFDNVQTVWHTEHMCKTIADVDAYLSIPYVPVEYDWSDVGRIRAETGENGIIMASLGDPACTAMEIMEFGEATIWALTETEHFAKTLAELHRRGMRNLKNMLEGGAVDLYRICGPEYITPPYLPPRFFERFVAPYVSDMTRLIHSYGGLVRIHSHGRIGRVLDMIADCGADAIDPCEAPPDGDIELSEIKRRIGKSTCIFGNMQLKLLEHGTPDAIRAAVKKCMDSAKADGGYVIMPTASPINIPLRQQTAVNYRIFIDAALEYGRY